MKSSRLCVSLALFLVFGGIGPVIAQSGETVVSLDLSELPLLMALEQIATKSGARFVVHPALSTRKGANVNLRDVPLLRAIPIMAAAYGVCASDTGRGIKIAPCDQ